MVNNKDHLNNFAPKSDKAIFLGYSTNKVAYRVLIRRTRLIVEIFDVKFDDYYVLNTAPIEETKFTLENDIPPSLVVLNIVEVNYGVLFNPAETANLLEISVSPVAQQHQLEVFGPTISEGTSFHTHRYLTNHCHYTTFMS